MTLLEPGRIVSQWWDVASGFSYRTTQIRMLAIKENQALDFKVSSPQKIEHEVIVIVKLCSFAMWYWHFPICKHASCFCLLFTSFCISSLRNAWLVASWWSTCGRQRSAAIWIAVLDCSFCLPPARPCSLHHVLRVRQSQKVLWNRASSDEITHVGVLWVIFVLSNVMPVLGDGTGRPLTSHPLLTL